MQRAVTGLETISVNMGHMPYQGERRHIPQLRPAGPAVQLSRFVANEGPTSWRIVTSTPASEMTLDTETLSKSHKNGFASPLLEIYHKPTGCT